MHELLKKSSTDTFHIRSISERRRMRQSGHFDDEVMSKIDAGFALCLALG